MSQEEAVEGAPKRPYLRKGDGTARFGMRNISRDTKPTSSTQQPTSSTQSPSFHLPHFTRSTSAIPQSARTVDSGISNEDETRPPTNASLPTDRPSSSPTEPAPAFNRPPIVEEHEDEEEYGRQHVEDVHEEVSSMPSFIPDSGASSLVEPATEQSESAQECRKKAEAIMKKGYDAKSMRSVSISPGSYTSDLSAPLGASTPITPHVELSSHRPPPIAQHSFPTETPQARPLRSHRVNMLAQNEAQTGISLLQMQRPQLQSRCPPQFQQKENIARPPTEHVYDQPVQMPFQHHHNTGAEQRRYRNMMLQLRDALAHADFQDVQMHKQAKMMYETWLEKKKLINERLKELEEEYRKKVELLEEENRRETEKIQRERRDLERERKILQKDRGEKDKDYIRMIEEMKKRCENAETTNAKVRQEVRNYQEKLKKKTEEFDKLSKDYERSKKTCTTLEKRIRSMRTEKEKEEREQQMIAQAENNRKKPFYNMNSSLPVTSSVRQTAPPVKKTVPPPPPPKQRTVSFADIPEEQSLEVIEDDYEAYIMKPVERMNEPNGPCTVFRDSFGETTKVMNTVENGTIFEYSNGDRCFTTAANLMKWHNFAVDGTIMMEIIPAKIRFIYHLKRQMEVKRPGDNITLISLNRLEVRTELIHDSNGFHVEIFDKNGQVIRSNNKGPETVSKYAAGQKYTFRDGEDRHVVVSAFDDFELVEPEFRMRWYQGKIIVGKIFGREGTNEKTIRFEIDPQTGDGKIESVNRQLVNGAAVKTLVFKWQRPN